MQLPAPLRLRIEELLGGVPAQDLTRAYEALSDRYRRTVTASSLQIQSRLEALAYAASRLPATYGAVSEALYRLQLACPGFTPATLLDLGAGPGTASLAAQEVWPELKVNLVEPNAHLGAVAQGLTAGAQLAPVRLAERPAHRADLVILSYVLNELSEAEQQAALNEAWRDTAAALVLIEAGTPLGHRTLLRARDVLLAAGGHLAAPCPHQLECPLRAAPDRWCHFSVRIERPGFHKLVKPGATLGYEDEKFSYLIVTRDSVTLPQARLIGHPHGGKLVELELCRNDGTTAQKLFSKRDDLYKAAKKMRWGDAL